MRDAPLGGALEALNDGADFGELHAIRQNEDQELSFSFRHFAPLHPQRVDLELIGNSPLAMQCCLGFWRA